MPPDLPAMAGAAEASPRSCSGRRGPAAEGSCCNWRKVAQSALIGSVPRRGAWTPVKMHSPDLPEEGVDSEGYGRAGSPDSPRPMVAAAACCRAAGPAVRPLGAG